MLDLLLIVAMFLLGILIGSVAIKDDLSNDCLQQQQITLGQLTFRCDVLEIKR